MARLKKKIEHEMCVLNSLQILCETLLIVKRTERCMMTMYICLNVKYPLLSYFNETRIFSVVFRKYSNIRYNENPSSGNRVVPCRRTDRHDEDSSRFSQFCDRV